MGSNRKRSGQKKKEGKSSSSNSKPRGEIDKVKKELKEADNPMEFLKIKKSLKKRRGVGEKTAQDIIDKAIKRIEREKEGKELTEKEKTENKDLSRRKRKTKMEEKIDRKSPEKAAYEYFMEKGKTKEAIKIKYGGKGEREEYTQMANKKVLENPKKFLSNLREKRRRGKKVDINEIIEKL